MMTNNQNDILLQAIEQEVEELYSLLHQKRDVSIQEKQQLLQARANRILSQLPDLNHSNHNSHCTTVDDWSTSQLSIEQKAKIYFLKGKALEVYQEYNKEAEEALSKAVKLNPSLMEAWNVLGHCLWKKNDLLAAKHCYSTALSLNRNKTSLRELSRILRLLDPRVEFSQEEKQIGGFALLQKKRKDNLIESIKLVKEAIKLDMSDGESWYVLGNAYFSNYASNSLDVADLDRALSAFKQAERSETTAQNPDLHYNRSMIYKHLGRYQEAYEGFKKSQQLDPSLLAASAQMREIEDLIHKCIHMTEKKGNLKQKDVQKITNKFPKSIGLVQNRYTEKQLAQLSWAGQVNKNCSVTVRIIGMLSLPTALPLVFLAMDRNAHFCVVSIYNIHSTAIKENDLLTLVDPLPEVIHFDEAILVQSDDKEGIGMKKQFNSIRVTVPLKLIVNQQTIPDAFIVSPSLAIQTFSS